MSKKKLALSYLMRQMWALDGSLLSVMAEIASRNDDDIDLSELSVFSPKALEGKTGRTLSPRMELREGGVAVIHLTGVISRYAGMFDDVCGGISTEALAKDFSHAMSDHAVTSVILNCDGPGGDANGIHEFAEMIYQERGNKPIKAYVGGTCASALYWIASACDEVVIDATARLGSIGVVLTLERIKESAESDVERLEIVSSQSPDKRLDPFSEKGQAAYQAQVDTLADIFIDRVARNMDLSRDVVLSDFGGGATLIGQMAVDKGMAHRLGSLEAVICELKNGSKSNMPKENTAASSTALTLPDTATLSASDLVAALTAQRPDAIEAIKGPAEEMALNDAAGIAKLCADNGVPELSATLLVDGMTKAAAENQITQAKGLKDTLAAAGLSGSYSALSGSLADPVALVGKAIHEAKAAADENSDQTRQIVDDNEPKEQSLCSKAIYEKRNKK
ncbi:S49 family peptidase [Pseudoalteromonas sp. MMG024]|uniref:S49 family peptidase n=1 Tax=Pseudoalteromonas sp. MMG024 TaxID=2909980 RepID=UPI0031BA3004|nr:S49 family peptidase [Pseudoalteromonas sp. MMG024]